MSHLVQYFGMRRNTRGKILIGYHEGGNGSNKVKNHWSINRKKINDPELSIHYHNNKTLFQVNFLQFLKLFNDVH